MLGASDVAVSACHQKQNSRPDGGGYQMMVVVALPSCGVVQEFVMMIKFATLCSIWKVAKQRRRQRGDGDGVAGCVGGWSDGELPRGGN